MNMSVCVSCRCIVEAAQAHSIELGGSCIQSLTKKEQYWISYSYVTAKIAVCDSHSDKLLFFCICFIPLHSAFLSITFLLFQFDNVIIRQLATGCRATRQQTAYSSCSNIKQTCCDHWCPRHKNLLLSVGRSQFFSFSSRSIE